MQCCLCVTIILAGPLPSSIGDMSALTYLDMSSNGLDGEESAAKLLMELTYPLQVQFHHR